MKKDLVELMLVKIEIPFTDETPDYMKPRFNTWGYSTGGENADHGIEFHDYNDKETIKIHLQRFEVNLGEEDSSVIHVYTDDKKIDTFYGSPEKDYKANLVSFVVKDIWDFINAEIKARTSKKQYEQLTLF